MGAYFKLATWEVMFWFTFGVIVLVALVYGIDVYRNRHPLTPEEVVRLAQKRRRNRAICKYDFYKMPRPASPAEKRAMRHTGEFVSCDLDYTDAPSRIAGLLKYKKHEWIVIAFISAQKITKMWWNKGPDGTRVWAFLRDHAFESSVRALKPDAIAILHNHPNPNPSRYRTNLPSDADLQSADVYEERLRTHGVSLLEFICERGIPLLYYAAFSESVVPIGPIVSEVEFLNGTGVFKNYALRKDLKSRTRGEQVAGPNRLPHSRADS